MLKRLIRPLAAVTLCLGTLGLGSQAALAATVVKLHHDLTEDSAQHEGALRFKKLVEERSDGDIQVKIFPNNALGDDVQVAQQMQFGAVQAAPIPTAKLSGFNKQLQLIDLPFLFPSRDVAYEFLDGPVGQRVLDGLRDAGFEPASFWESGFKQMTCDKPVHEPADLDGVKFRVMESPLLIAQYKAVGANPVPIAFSETYTALQQGVVDCQENPLVSISQMKFYEVQDYLMLSNHGYLGTAFIFSKVWFDKLPEAQRTILMDAAREAGQYQRERSIAREQGYLDGIKDAGGTEVVVLTDDQKQAFRDAMDPVYEEFGAILGEDLMQATRQELDRLNEGQ
ncbi:TRAP transporter substrate-binding protein [Alcanivorax sp. IO_7]|nr:TRAP transporter substrate-binding protein [Alcanivorax sp. IO_7]